MASTFWTTPNLALGLHHFRFRANEFDCLPHTHAEYNVSLCLEGRIEYFVQGQCKTVRNGELLVINPGELHQGRYGSDQIVSEGITFYLTKYALRNLLRQMRLPYDAEQQSVVLVGSTYDQRVQQLTRDLLSELRHEKRGYEVMIQSCLLQILIYLLRNGLEPTVVNAKSEVPHQLPAWHLSKAIEYMNTHGKSHFSLSELCSELGTHPSTFIRLFKNSARMPPHDFYNRVLVAKAQRQLRMGESVKEVAYALGFQSDSHFCRLFRSISCTTPRNYQLRELKRISPSLYQASKA